MILMRIQEIHNTNKYLQMYCFNLKTCTSTTHNYGKKRGKQICTEIGICKHSIKLIAQTELLLPANSEATAAMRKDMVTAGPLVLRDTSPANT